MNRFSPGGLLHLLVATTLAVVYFLFQVEPFEEEYRESHPPAAGTSTFSKPSINWESFDKTNAPKAFTVDPVAPTVLVLIVQRADRVISPRLPPVHPVRDKSPPTPTA